MARTLKHEDYAARRNEILDVAQRLIYTRGYEEMSVQDILVELNISKGAFYHYFDSKQALLEGIVERTAQQITQLLLPMVHDPEIPALAKFQRIMDTGARWKSARKELMFAILHAWYNDDNALVRHKITQSMYAHVGPWLAEIFHQGIAQGVLAAESPEHAAQVVLTLTVGMGDAVGHLLMSITPDSTPQQRKACLRQMSEVSAAYTGAIERFLGVRNGALELFSPKVMKEWVYYPGSPAAETAAQATAPAGRRN